MPLNPFFTSLHVSNPFPSTFCNTPYYLTLYSLPDTSSNNNQCLTLSPQAISNPKSEKHQDVAWKAVCPSVLMLRKFYDFALELETALCELLTVLCSPEMTALQHLEKQQVREGAPLIRTP